MAHVSTRAVAAGARAQVCRVLECRVRTSPAVTARRRRRGRIGRTRAIPLLVSLLENGGARGK
jgi:hypothetical protein